jgi:hypothetical protein
VAVGVASVAGHPVAVVALLGVVDDAVSAPVRLAVGTAGVRRRVAVGCAVVAGLAWAVVDDAVSAELGLAGRAAAVAAVRVPVVTLLAVVQDGVAAVRELAIRSARVGQGVAVADPVVASLGLATVEHAVPALLGPARRGAAITGHQVAIVALLAGVEGVVAAVQGEPADVVHDLEREAHVMLLSVGEVRLQQLVRPREGIPVRGG